MCKLRVSVIFARFTLSLLNNSCSIASNRNLQMQVRHNVSISVYPNTLHFLLCILFDGFVILLFISFMRELVHVLHAVY